MPYLDLDMSKLLANPEDEFHVLITVTVVNLGTMTTPPTIVTVEYATGSFWRDIRSLGVPPMSPKGQYTVTFRWAYDYQIGRFDLRSTVDPANEIAEAFENNNLATSSAFFVTSATPGIATAAMMRDAGLPSPPAPHPELLEFIAGLDPIRTAACLRQQNVC